MPIISKDGKTYTFTVKQGLQVQRRRSDRRRSLRVRDQPCREPAMQSPVVPFITDIVGLQAVVDKKASTRQRRHRQGQQARRSS